MIDRCDECGWQVTVVDVHEEESDADARERRRVMVIDLDCGHSLSRPIPDWVPR